MPSLSDVPSPYLGRAEQTPQSDIAPRPGTTPAPGALPELSRVPHLETSEEDRHFPPGAFAPDDAIDDQIADLERWALANERRERNESVRFWILRGTAFLNAAFSAGAGGLGYGQIAIILAGCAALFIAIDAAWPGSAQRSPYRRAVYDLRALQNMVKIRWDKVRLAYPDPTGTKRVAHALALLDTIQSRREDIGKYLGSAESSRGIKKP